ncbi:MAG: glycine cleavage protein (aminomethyl transferase), partial [Bryobacterales bacterium]|nr:glycine cleavage protein (aminomethyl transferase) [Bryobacterales bacterium]
METVPQTQLSATSSGYEALRTSAAWLDLSSRGKIVATGDDRARLLHAMLTNHIQQLQPGEGCYAFFLNAQGRILTDVNVFCRAEDFLLDVEPETRKSLYEHLDKYIIADDVTLEDVTDRTATIDLEGPQAHEFARRLEIPVPDKPWAHTMWNDILVANVTFTGAPGLRFFGSLEQKAGIIERLQNVGAPEAGPDVARVVR